MTEENKYLRYVILLSHTGKKPMSEAMVRAHVAHLKSLGEKYVLGGPFKDYKGGMYVIQAASIEAAKKIAEADPFVQEEIESYEIRTWELSNAENNHMGMG